MPLDRPAAPFPLASLRRPVQQHFIAAWGPPQFTDWIDESLSWKQTCYIGDWSFLPALRYTGPNVLKLFSGITVNTLADFAVGQSKHIIHCNGDGKIIEEGILSRTGEEEFIAFSTFWAEYVREQGGHDVPPAEAVPLTKFHVQGPNALYVMEQVCGQSLRHLKFMRFCKVDIAGVKDVMVLRQGMTGEIGFEVQGPMAHAKAIWAAIVEAGQAFGIREMGGRVGMINHLEANYPTQHLDYLPAIFTGPERGYLDYLKARYGALLDEYYRIAGSFEADDITGWYRSPVEFGWGNRIRFDHVFTGSEALRQELAAPKRRIATLVWNADDVIDVYAALFRQQAPLPDYMEMPQEPRGFMYADRVLKDGREVGVSTSRGYSAYFREMLSLCVIDLEHHAPGTEVTVLWGAPGTAQREIRATVAPAPYKTDRGRVDFATLPVPPRQPA